MKKWDENLWLLTLEEFTEIPNGVILECIDGEKAVKGLDTIDTDTRYGCLAYGLTKKLVEEQNLQQDFLLLLLKS